MDHDQPSFSESDASGLAGDGGRNGDRAEMTTPQLDRAPADHADGAAHQTPAHLKAFGRVTAGPWHADGLSAASSLAERIVETTSTVLVALDVELRVRSANPAFYDLFQVAPAEIIGHELFALGNGEWDAPWLRASLGQLLSLDGHLEDIELEINTPLLGRRTMLLNARRLVGLGAADLILLTVEDVTARRAAEQQRRAFSLLLAHELRNPLTAILGYAQLMQRHAGNEAAPLSIILAQANQLNRLVDDLLESSSRGSEQLQLQPRQMDLTALAFASVHRAQVLYPAHRVRLVPPIGPLSGRWDEDRLAQVFANLIGNAIKYSPDGGEIVVWVADLGAAVRVSVQDHGVGIEPDELPHLFDQLYRTAATARQVDGLGIGLHVVKVLVEAHGGTLGVESAPGLGSTFHFTLPLPPAAHEIASVARP